MGPNHLDTCCPFPVSCDCSDQRSQRAPLTRQFTLAPRWRPQVQTQWPQSAVAVSVGPCELNKGEGPAASPGCCRRSPACGHVTLGRLQDRHLRVSLSAVSPQHLLSGSFALPLPPHGDTCGGLQGRPWYSRLTAPSQDPQLNYTRRCVFFQIR